MDNVGRPTKYSKEISNKICEQIVMGNSLRTVCMDENLPCVATIFNWFTVYPEFLEQYTRAKQEQADAMAEEILDISDDGTNDWMRKHGKEDLGYSVNGEHIQRSRLRVESRKWLMSKMKPKKYGDSTQVKHADADGNKLSFGSVLEVLDGRTGGIPADDK